VNAGSGATLPVYNDVSKRGRGCSASYDERCVYVVRLELGYDGITEGVVANLGDEGGREAETGGSGESIASVTSALEF